MNGRNLQHSPLKMQNGIPMGDGEAQGSLTLTQSKAALNGASLETLPTAKKN